ncbi:MAG: hypothetical protein C0483_11390 [Pirellula sp.]|nr:hypothetical protein [Pirellula sp.]
MAYYLMFEITGEQKLRKAAIAIADQVLKDMRATKFGVLPIKEKEKPGGEKIIGGGPPALGAYASLRNALHERASVPSPLLRKLSARLGLGLAGDLPFSALRRKRGRW